MTKQRRVQAAAGVWAVSVVLAGVTAAQDAGTAPVAATQPAAVTNEYHEQVRKLAQDARAKQTELTGIRKALDARKRDLQDNDPKFKPLGDELKALRSQVQAKEKELDELFTQDAEAQKLGEQAAEIEKAIEGLRDRMRDVVQRRLTDKPATGDKGQ